MTNYTTELMEHPSATNKSYPTGVMGTAARRLVLSDNPESITSVAVDGSILYADSSNLTNGSKKYRVVVWHTNSTQKSIRVALTLENKGTTAMTFDACTRAIEYASATGDIVTPGMNNAKACLSASMSSFTPVDSVIESGATGIVFVTTYANAKHMGAIYEFTVKGSGSSNLVLRTVAIPATSDTTNDYGKLRSVKGTVVSLSGNHPRGAWNTYELKATADTFAVSATATEKLYLLSAGTAGNDNVFKAGTSYDKDNAGHYGVNYVLTIPLKNTTNSTKKIGIYVDPRAATYAGACKYNSEIKGIPVLHYKVNETTKDEVVKIDTITLAANGSKEVKLTLMHACGATLAVGLYCVVE